MNQDDPLTLPELTEDQLAADPRIAMRRMTFEFLLQQEYFATAATMVAEYIGTVQRIEAAESSGNLSPPSVKQAAILWRNEIRGFKYWFSANHDTTIADLMQQLTNKGIQQFVTELVVELQINHP